MKLIQLCRFALALLILFSIPESAYTFQNQDTTRTQSAFQSQQNPVNVQKQLPDDLSIENLYSYMIEKSNTYQDYRVIRESWVNRFRLRLNDTIKNLRNTITGDQTIIINKSRQIDSLDYLLKETNDKLASVLKEKNSLRMFGILMSKRAYDALMWTIIIGLLVILGFLFVLYKRSFILTRQTKKDLQELKDEFEDYRRKALKSKEEAVKMIYDELKKFKK